MPNEKGWLTKEEVKRTGKPILIPDPDGTSGKWHNGNPPGGGLLLTRTSCEKFCPVADDEEPVAFMYNGKAVAPYRYVPYFFRTKDQINS
ncbi:hypothetical protein [Paenibacillus medicaginis]|uniref:Uncharacterized protein n=1 Tax=Paenibacillus medicaginis TaxID=1470560 RepID=A0ABV5C0L1_9BACL